jgi:hypothetical protein
MPPSILPPSGDLSDRPDAETRKGLDFTAGSAENRVLFINLGIFRYGTDDKAHAAAIALSAALLIVAVGIIAAGLFSTNAPWLDKVLAWVSNAFLFVAGVSIGQGGREPPREG